MREHKYRGKRLDNGEWVYGGLIADGKGNYAIAKLVILNNCNTASVHMVDPATVGQYTGLKDKNGKEIYEGDIVHWNEYVGKVIFKNGLFARKFKNVSAPLVSLLLVTEVIGNIHDNPELLINLS